MLKLLLWYVHDCDYDNDTGVGSDTGVDNDTGVDSDVADKDDDTNSTFTKCCTKNNQLTLQHALYRSCVTIHLKQLTSN